MKRGLPHFLSRLARIAAFTVIGLSAMAFVLSLPPVAGALTDRLQTFPALGASELGALSGQPETAIVVLSAGRRSYAPEFGGETVDEVALERIRYAAEVARATRLPVLAAGGFANAERAPLARLMAEVLARDYGIDTRWLETRSRSTAENALYSAQILKRAGIRQVVLVTHAWHMPRARAAFLANGMAVIPAPTAFYGRAPESGLPLLVPSTRALRMSGFAIHETLGRAWYAVKYGY